MSSAPSNLSSSPRQQAIARAIQNLLEALGQSEQGELLKTAERVAALWDERLLPASRLWVLPPPATISPLLKPSFVFLGPIDIHVICPHHLTVAQGTAQIAYLPQTHLPGLGDIVQLCRHALRQLILQETAGQEIADALCCNLGVSSAWVRLEARHVCASLSEPEAHQARLITVATAGDASTVGSLAAFAAGEWKKL